MPLPVDPEVGDSSSASATVSGAATQSTVTGTGTTLTPIWTSTPTSQATTTQAPVATPISSPQTPLISSTSKPLAVIPKPLPSTSTSNVFATTWTPVVTQTPTTLRTSPLRSAPASMTSTTDMVFGAIPPPPAEPTDSSSAGIISASPNESTGKTPPPIKKSGGSVVGGVAGTISALVVIGLLALFLWRWRVKQRWRNRRLSFGPHGNGIDASRGNVLVSSVACKPADSISIGDSAYETDDYFPPPRSRYFQPTVDTGRMLLRPIPSIAEVSERDSGDFEKPAPKITMNFNTGSTNPFDDMHDIEKILIQPDMSSMRRKPPPPPMSDRSMQHIRSRSFDSMQEQRPQLGWESTSHDMDLDNAMRLGRMNYYNRQGGPRQDFYGNPQNHPYHRNGSVDPRRMHSVQRTRRSASIGGGAPRYPRNPVLDGPAWRSIGPAPPPLRRPSFNQGSQFSMNPPGGASSELTRKTSTTSLRERPSPELWASKAGPEISAPLHLSRSNTKTVRPSPSPENSFSNAWGSVSNYVQGDRPPGSRHDAGTARNF